MTKEAKKVDIRGKLQRKSLEDIEGFIPLNFNIDELYEKVKNKSDFPKLRLMRW